MKDRKHLLLAFVIGLLCIGTLGKILSFSFPAQGVHQEHMASFIALTLLIDAFYFLPLVLLVERWFSAEHSLRLDWCVRIFAGLWALVQIFYIVSYFLGWQQSWVFGWSFGIKDRNVVSLLLCSVGAALAPRRWFIEHDLKRRS